MKNSFFNKIKSNRIFSRYGYLLLAFIAPALLMCASYFAFGVFPFGKESVLVLDLNAQYVYFFGALRRAFYGDASLIYSFSRALGGEFLGIFGHIVDGSHIAVKQLGVICGKYAVIGSFIVILHMIISRPGEEIIRYEIAE